jgi:hypothetical protein
MLFALTIFNSGNRIANINELDKLASCKSLKRLSLHGIVVWCRLPEARN